LRYVVVGLVGEDVDRLAVLGVECLQERREKLEALALAQELQIEDATETVRDDRLCEQGPGVRVQRDVRVLAASDDDVERFRLPVGGGLQSPPSSGDVDHNDLLASLKEFFRLDGRGVGLSPTAHCEDGLRLRDEVWGQRKVSGDVELLHAGFSVA